MKAPYLLLIRIVLSLAMALVISRFFFEGASMLKVMALAAVMLVLAYLFECAKRRDRDG